MDFQTVARTLAPFISNVHDLLDATQAVMTLPGAHTNDYTTHEGRVRAALANPKVLDHLRNGNKISAIKELRGMHPNVNMGLREAKDAVEDARVIIYYRPRY